MEFPTTGEMVLFQETGHYYPNAAIVLSCNHAVAPGKLTLRVLNIYGGDITVMGASRSEMQDLVAHRATGEKFVINGHWMRVGSVTSNEPQDSLPAV